ncbi:DUF4352 domain-containing protein [Vagococcus silagei]|uniref:DUF4352 domain-containing protein n=1 Tax=Vagococcus silagei TaxID=2508885 RepID=A0A4V3TUU1_9ENTE|nr:DUF4352 domain-containing protein [Vagococcus silagei]THB60269.1 DUF4352 domain-containing protein [Vagococcus silagei]
MKKQLVLLTIGLTALTLGGCNKPKEADKKSAVSTATSKKLEKKTTESTTKKEKSDSGDWSAINDTLKSTTEAKDLKVVYEKNEAIKNENQGVSVTLNGYENVEIKNFSNDLNIPFGNQNETGNVVLFSTTIKNDTKEPVYVGPGFTMYVTGYSPAISRKPGLLDKDLVDELVSVKNELPAGKEISGYVAAAIKPEAMAKINEHKTAKLELPGIFKKQDSFKKEDALLEFKEVEIPLVGEGEDTLAKASEFYKDKATADNWGTKKMISEKKVGEEKSFSDIKVKFDGYQVTEFEPNEDQKPRFKKLDKGIILMTTSVTIKNDSKEAISFNTTSATLTVGDSVKMMNEKYLEVDGANEKLEPGKTDTKYLVFVMDKESYDKLYKDQEYNLDVSLYDQKFARMTNIDDLSFKFKN